ncbi:MAG: hypothetical protein H6548_10260 [Chitinophagales bacterium]|nr:hypothetical protein [Chitinophagales bacterium]HAE13733.1 hypothetical protein [Bacteroidota bacterium]MCB9019086.1 hypothetical protein [Chitinophagales bacterium]MCB9022489.1 hypothetical protein [Chitinophagales bacterium]HAE34851.1 hypothetical protein [Bacteroidota bacterium]
MDTTETAQRPDWSDMWEGLYYLSFFIFATLVVIPNLGKTLTFGYDFRIAMIPYGTIGVFAGMGVYRLVRNAPVWLKMGIILLIYAAVMYQLITHVDRFTIPDL